MFNSHSNGRRLGAAGLSSTSGGEASQLLQTQALARPFFFPALAFSALFLTYYMLPLLMVLLLITSTLSAIRLAHPVSILYTTQTASPRYGAQKHHKAYLTDHLTLLGTLD